MREHRDDQAPECADEGMRDALPALDHGRLSSTERVVVESHVATCGSCAAELALLRGARGVLTSAAPTLDLDRLAAAVAAATRPDAVPLQPSAVLPLRPRRPAWAERLQRVGGLRAAAALLVVVLGAGTVLTRSGDGGTDATAGATAGRLANAGADGHDTVRGSRAAGSSIAAAGRSREAHVLGDGFDDLNDAELSAVLDAIGGEGASLPSLEPVVYAMDYVGGDL